MYASAAALTLPSHAAAPAAVVGTDLVLSTPERMVAGVAPELRVLRPLPYYLSGTPARTSTRATNGCVSR
ncbi:hypothetical protein ACQPXB_35110 [Amycolatopsis sp. CA-161197]|uniref:hypothetical protein n=1 Tax=unclassified Amycolatopsis TaxID=2618356 RepID=UPI0034528BCB